MSKFWDDFKGVVGAIKASGDPLIDGKLYDPQAKVACASATLFLKLPRGGWRLEPGSPAARQLSRLTQYEVDSALAKRYRVPLWEVEYAVFDESSAAIEANEFLAQREPADAYGAAGSSLRRLAQYLETRTKTQWRKIRATAGEEFVHTRTLAEQYSTAVQAATRAHTPFKVAQLENWLWTVGFRCAWRSSPPSRRATVDTRQWDAAWPARVADLARRGGVRILGGAQGVQFDERVSHLSLLGYR